MEEDRGWKRRWEVVVVGVDYGRGGGDWSGWLRAQVQLFTQ
jgi:hypothetical protein